MRALRSATKINIGINGDGVMCYKPDDDCDSDEPGDEWEWVGEGKAGLKKK